MQADLDTIAHLDFDIGEAMPCHGVLITNHETGRIKLFKKCDTPPQFSVNASCCGAQYLFCMECFNIRVDRIVAKSKIGSWMNHNACNNPFPIPPYINIQPL